MNNETHDFDTWFDTLQSHVLARACVNFRDEDSVRTDYDGGRDVFEVIDEIIAEYSEDFVLFFCH